MWFYELKTVAHGRTKYRWERVRKTETLDDTASALRSGNLPALGILRLLLEDSNPNLQLEDHVIGGLHREWEPAGHRCFFWWFTTTICRTTASPSHRTARHGRTWYEVFGSSLACEARRR